MNVVMIFLLLTIFQYIENSKSFPYVSQILKSDDSILGLYR